MKAIETLSLYPLLIMANEITNPSQPDSGTEKLSLKESFDKIINKVSRDERIDKICQSIVKGDLAQDLKQEFLLVLLQYDKEKLVSAESEGYLDFLCVTIIKNVWGKSGRVKRSDKGNTNPLHLHSNTFFELNNSNWNDQVQEYDIEKDFLLNSINNNLNEIIEKYKESEDRSDRFRARVFYYTYFKYKYVRKFSIASGIPYLVCMGAYKEFLKTIKKEICLKK